MAEVVACFPLAQAIVTIKQVNGKISNADYDGKQFIKSIRIPYLFLTDQSTERDIACNPRI